MNEIKVEYVPSLKDHIEAYTAYEKNTISRKFDKITAFILILCGLYLIILSVNKNQFTSISILAILFISFGIFELIGPFNLGKLLYAISFKTNPKFKETQKIRFSENGLHYQITGIQSDIEWSFYNKYLESENTLILIFGKRQYSIIPKAAFKENDLLNLQEFIKKRLLASDL